MSFYCNCCNKNIDSSQKNRHFRTKLHINNQGKNEVVPDNNLIEKNIDTSDDFSIESTFNNANDDNYLNDFTSDKFTLTPVPETNKPAPKPATPMPNKYLENAIKSRQKAFKTPKIKDDCSVSSDNLFSSKPSKILGKERLELLARIRNYKQLFSDKLSKFKIKKNATKDELQEYLDEINAILETSQSDSFLNDSIFHLFQIVENVSIRTKYNLAGFTELLKGNVEFRNLVKILSSKYASFASVSPEIQVCFIIVSLGYITISKNQELSRISSQLNQPFNG